VERVIDKFVGEVKLVESGGRLRIDQEELETVIPAVGGSVLIVNGKGKGLLAELLELDVDNYAAKVKVVEGVLKGETLKAVAYEDISKTDRDFLGR
jgi:DNA/RNA-binding protein KIN17